ncbi:MFS transporter [Marinomonas colpomeniae]|uniref:MFS transporter n=1 Tax=Marinomonas colpomeniae TaxID=2774408 RepID=A0ABR8NVN9_9GAMM|nr:MFS transporter [Marinomonas colpomeniae]MBD5770120.1 MFS transporter [Marinomonas colpomeniae]
MSKISALPKYIYLYFLCQSLNLTVTVISVTVAATVGLMIAPDQSWATLPYGMQFLFMLLATYPASVLMEKKGRKVGFIVGALGLIGSGMVGFSAVMTDSFLLLIIAHSLLGCFMACANYYRFAAVDNLIGKTKTRAVSLVIAGGLVAAVLGPFIASSFRDIGGFPLFALCYLALVMLAGVNLILIVFLPNEVEKKITKQEKEKRDLVDQHWLKNVSPLFLLAVVTAAFSYGIMNLIMVQSSLQMHHLGIHFDHSAMAIQWHVVAMFAPSFLSGYLISRLGHQKVIFIGLAFFLATFIINIVGTSYSSIVLSLIFLGVAWNFTYVSGSAYIAVILEGNKSAKKLQGIGDTGIALFAMLGAMTPALLMSTIGWAGTNFLSIGLILFCLVLLILFIILHKRNALNPVGAS